MNSELTRDEKLWGMLCHISAFAFFIFPFGNILAPLILWMIKKDESPYIDRNGKESLNFQISMILYAIISALLVLILIGFILLFALLLLDFILVVVAAIKANDGIEYKYPMTIQFIK